MCCSLPQAAAEEGWLRAGGAGGAPPGAVVADGVGAPPRQCRHCPLRLQHLTTVCLLPLHTLRTSFRTVETRTSEGIRWRLQHRTPNRALVNVVQM